MNNETTLIDKKTYAILSERKTARLDVLIQPTIKQMAKEKAEKENTDLSKIINEAIIQYLVS
ncbi:hypothetical protein [Ralstonia mannitolilytica]|uniref:hypothetical protein n=1 Tax=Ralstonia mannitolilytica TaxID=105219 RepID=UPI001C98A82D|nr:hypothetical protein [Ralstonia mannitolilytica]MBY4717502.1 hypothetical protein [Ralstonia mannitolilytica]